MRVRGSAATAALTRGRAQLSQQVEGGRQREGELQQRLREVAEGASDAQSTVATASEEAAACRAAQEAAEARARQAEARAGVLREEVREAEARAEAARQELRAAARERDQLSQRLERGAATGDQRDRELARLRAELQREREAAAGERREAAQLRLLFEQVRWGAALAAAAAAACTQLALARQLDATRQQLQDRLEQAFVAIDSMRRAREAAEAEAAQHAAQAARAEAEVARQRDLVVTVDAERDELEVRAPRVAVLRCRLALPLCAFASRCRRALSPCVAALRCRLALSPCVAASRCRLALPPHPPHFAPQRQLDARAEEVAAVQERVQQSAAQAQRARADADKAAAERADALATLLQRDAQLRAVEAAARAAERDVRAMQARLEGRQAEVAALSDDLTNMTRENQVRAPLPLPQHCCGRCCCGRCCCCRVAAVVALMPSSSPQAVSAECAVLRDARDALREEVQALAERALLLQHQLRAKEAEHVSLPPTDCLAVRPGSRTHARRCGNSTSCWRTTAPCARSARSWRRPRRT